MKEKTVLGRVNCSASTELFSLKEEADLCEQESYLVYEKNFYGNFLVMAEV